MDVDLERAHRRFQDGVFWTFHTNFLPGETPDTVLGCLRYYWRNNEEQTFVGELDSAVVVACTIVNNDPNSSDASGVQPQTPNILIESSAQARPAGDPSLPQRMALFNGEAHVQCPIDISATLGALAAEPEQLGLDLLLPPSDEGAVLDAIASLIGENAHAYGEFMAAAAVGRLALPVEDAMPLFVYEASADMPLDAGIQPVYELEFAVDPLGGVSGLGDEELVSRATLAQGRYWGDPSQPACIVRANPPEGQYLWESFGQCATADDGECRSAPPGQATYLQLLSREVGQNTPIECTVPFEQVETQAAPFWSGPAVIFIGFHPRTQETFAGEMYEVWIDPDSSVRPPNG
jgi:hypothetical protein